MKHFLIIGLLLNFSLLEAQVYHPFPTDSAEWRIDIEVQGQFGMQHYPRLLYMQGDTTIDGKDYHKIFTYGDSVAPLAPTSPASYIREQNKIIYYRSYLDTAERILYNFNLNVNDTVWVYNSSVLDSFVVISKDSVLTSTGYRNSLILNSLSGILALDQMQWVEGIGELSVGPFYFDIPWVDTWYHLLCFHEHDSLIWTYQGTCWILGIDESELRTDYHNYFPNPFSDNVNVNYFLSKPGNISAELLDVSGKLLKKITYREVNTGQHSISFDTHDLAPGIYLYRLKKNDTVSIGKMIKLK